MAGEGRLRKVLKVAGTAVGVLFVAAQFFPYGREHSNPPVVKEPAWDTPRTRELAARACFDCHGNQTRWPWYSNVAPASWLVQHDVDEGRRKVNFSEWNRPYEEADEAAEAVTKGEMPPWFYVMLHPEALLTPEEKQALVRGLEATPGMAESEKVGEGEGERDGDKEGEGEHDRD